MSPETKIYTPAEPPPEQLRSPAYYCLFGFLVGIFLSTLFGAYAVLLIHPSQSQLDKAYYRGVYDHCSSSLTYLGVSQDEAIVACNHAVSFTQQEGWSGQQSLGFALTPLPTYTPSPSSTPLPTTTVPAP